ncbi:hypothetical protein FP568_07095 [Pandoraea pnomenusa]|uniref:hypothetical protein n=1 Tax=Pandoraea pnomenusa TaxID=93220 RepID=UPI001198918B|nr:hypothetical protein [Pandoraea pnomenusa]QDX21036.1 hypothetical protein FP568_07095 [Pandoraea pnomenusa]
MKLVKKWNANFDEDATQRQRGSAEFPTLTLNSSILSCQSAAGDSIVYKKLVYQKSLTANGRQRKEAM